MKETTGEGSMTIVTIVVIVALAAAAIAVLAIVSNKAKDQADNTETGYNCSTNAAGEIECSQN